MAVFLHIGHILLFDRFRQSVQKLKWPHKLARTEEFYLLHLMHLTGERGIGIWGVYFFMKLSSVYLDLIP